MGLFWTSNLIPIKTGLGLLTDAEVLEVIWHGGALQRPGSGARHAMADLRATERYGHRGADRLPACAGSGGCCPSRSREGRRSGAGAFLPGNGSGQLGRLRSLPARPGRYCGLPQCCRLSSQGSEGCHYEEPHSSQYGGGFGCRGSFASLNPPDTWNSMLTPHISLLDGSGKRNACLPKRCAERETLRIPKSRDLAGRSHLRWPLRACVITHPADFLV